MEYKELNKQFWVKHMWTGDYFAASSGNVTDEAIAEYIRNQELKEEKKKDNFEINRLLAAFSRKYVKFMDLIYISEYNVYVS